MAPSPSTAAPHPLLPALVLCLAATLPLAAQPTPTPPPTDTPLTDREIVDHVLSRLAFGPRPGEAETLLADGWQTWVRRQLTPDAVIDADWQAHLQQRYPSLSMSMADIFTTYRPPIENDPPTKRERQRRQALRTQVRDELRSSVLDRAIHSEAQFAQVICEFWRNHFNIDQNKSQVAYLANHYEQHVIRAHAFGRFEDMLLASARHPAMLIYLDNHVSQKPLGKYEQRMVERYEGRARKPESVIALQRYRGLNENYARELMELHTLGVDSGYTQHDVTELARVLTGWTARWTDDGEYGFHFNPDVHDTDPKRLLGHSIARNGGLEEGEQIIRGLARDRRTATFIASKLCAYLVHDDPDPRLVRRIAKVFDRTGGNLPDVYEAIIFSDQFTSRRSYRAKFKTPFEFVTSTLRATGARIRDLRPTLSALDRMGQSVYRMPDPTGYDDRAERWLDPGVLAYRWHFALQIGRGQIKGITLPARYTTDLAGQPADRLKTILVQALLPGGLDPRTDTILSTRIRARPEPAHALGLLLGTPSFQQQ